jgi:hypothetical protein
MELFLFTAQVEQNSRLENWEKKLALTRNYTASATQLEKTHPAVPGGPFHCGAENEAPEIEKVPRNLMEQPVKNSDGIVKPYLTLAGGRIFLLFPRDKDPHLFFDEGCEYSLRIDACALQV